MFARQTPLPNNKNCRHGQATLEYLLAMGALLTSALVGYPLMMRAYDVYLNSIFYILNLAFP